MKSYVRLLGARTAGALLLMLAAGAWIAYRATVGSQDPASYVVATYLLTFPVVQYLLAKGQIARIHTYASLQRTADVAARELTDAEPEIRVSRRARGPAAGTAPSVS